MNKRYFLAVIGILTCTSSLFVQVDSTFFTPPSWSEPETIFTDITEYDICDLGDGKMLAVAQSQTEYLLYRIYEDDRWSEIDTILTTSAVYLYLYSDSEYNAWLLFTNYNELNLIRFSEGIWGERYPLIRIYSLSASPILGYWVNDTLLFWGIGDEWIESLLDFYKIIPPDSIHTLPDPIVYYTTIMYGATKYLHAIGDTFFCVVDRRSSSTHSQTLFLCGYIDSSWIIPDTICDFAFSLNIAPMDYYHDNEFEMIYICNFSGGATFFIYKKERTDWLIYNGPSHPSIITRYAKLLADRYRNVYWLFISDDEEMGYFIFDGERFSPIYYLPYGVKLGKTICDTRGRIWNIYKPFRTNYLVEIHTTDFTSVNNDLKSQSTILNIYPNPFNSTLNIDIASSKGTVIIYNLNGAEVKRIPIDKQAIWNGKNNRGIDCPSGIYLVRLESEGINRITQKVILLK